MRFAFIERYEGSLPRSHLCRMLGVSDRGLRAWRTRPMCQRQTGDLVLLAHIREQHRLSLGSYGRPRMTEELKELGLNVGHRRVGRLMKCNDISAVRTRKYRVTTDSDHTFNIAPNLLERDFTADRPNQKCPCGAAARRLSGNSWAVSNRLKRDLAVRALTMAINLRQPPPGCLHHTDRGSQYCSHDYQKLLRQHGFQVSRSGKGCCYDNAAVETFFKTLKAELIWRSSWQTRRQVEIALFKYINGFYNPRRKHSALGWKSPLAFERKAA